MSAQRVVFEVSVQSSLSRWIVRKPGTIAGAIGTLICKRSVPNLRSGRYRVTFTPIKKAKRA